MSEKELAGATQSALRPSGMQALELQISTELAIGLFNAKPLEKIRHILEAYMLLPIENQEKLANKENMSIYKRMHTIALSFLNMQILTDPWGERYAMIPFPFNPNLGREYFEFFLKALHYNGEDGKQLAARFKQDENIRRAYFSYLTKWLSSEASLNVAFSIKTDFERWSIPRVVRLAETIITTFISKETWEQALAATIGTGNKNARSSSADILTS